VVPVKTVSELNRREHWTVRADRTRTHREAAFFAAAFVCGDAELWRRHVPLVVHMTRVGTSRCDSDAVPGACKHVRDGIADWLGIDDGRDDLVTWEYAQETAGFYCVRVTISSASTRAPAFKVGDLVVVEGKSGIVIDYGRIVQVNNSKQTVVLEDGVEWPLERVKARS
jgi:hypothetical protein